MPRPEPRVPALQGLTFNNHVTTQILQFISCSGKSQDKIDKIFKNHVIIQTLQMISCIDQSKDNDTKLQNVMTRNFTDIETIYIKYQQLQIKRVKEEQTEATEQN
jgi:hypothetical protein